MPARHCYTERSSHAPHCINSREAAAQRSIPAVPLPARSDTSGRRMPSRRSTRLHGFPSRRLHDTWQVSFNAGMHERAIEVNLIACQRQLATACCMGLSGPHCANVGNAGLLPRVYSTNASSRFSSNTSIARGSKASAACKCLSVELAITSSRIVPGAIADDPLGERKFEGSTVKFQHQLADRLLEVIGGTIDPEHPVDQNADSVRNPFHVSTELPAEQNRPPLSLNDLNHRLQKIPADHGIQLEGRVVENQKFRIGRHRQGQRNLPHLRWTIGECVSYAGKLKMGRIDLTE